MCTVFAHTGARARLVTQGPGANALRWWPVTAIHLYVWHAERYAKTPPSERMSHHEQMRRACQPSVTRERLATTRMVALKQHDNAAISPSIGVSSERALLLLPKVKVRTQPY